MSQPEQSKIYSNEESQETEVPQNTARQDMLIDPGVSKKTGLAGTDQIAVSAQPEDKGKYNQYESSMNTSNIDSIISERDNNIKKQSDSSINSVFQGLRTAYEQFEERSERDTNRDKHK